MRSIRPVMVVLNGLPGAGKTTTASLLSAKGRYRVLSSDHIRREFFAHHDLGGIRYTPHASRVVYEIVMLRAQTCLLQRESVICDGMNNYPPGWARYVRVAEETNATLCFLDIVVPIPVLRARVSQRHETGMAQVMHERLLAQGNGDWATEDPAIRKYATAVRWNQGEGMVEVWEAEHGARRQMCESPSDIADLLLILFGGG